MKKIYSISLALLFAGGVIAQNTTVKVAKKLDASTQSITKKGIKEQASTENQLKSTNAVLNETFEVSVPPAGWDATAEWALSTTSQGTSATGATGFFAFFDAYDLDAEVEGTLVTPILQPVTGDNTLSYSVNYYKRSTNTAYQSTGAELYIEFSTDNGANWTTSTTNVLAALPNYNSLNTGWTTLNVDLSAYNTQNVQVRFRAVSDYGWANIGIDNVTGPNVFSLNNELSAGTVFANMNSFDYFQMIPNSQMNTVDFGVKITNNGLAAQTNVTVHADINNGSFTGATGLNNPTASFAAATVDTLWANTTPTATTNTEFATKLWVSQTETDELPNNNIADSVYFYGTNTSYLRSMNVNSILSSYSFGSQAPAVTGFEYGATYLMANPGRVDSISTLIYKSSGTGNIVGKLYTIDINTGAYTLVGQTAAYSPVAGSNTNFDLTTLALQTPFTATAMTVLAATIQINGNFTTAPKDTIYIAADNAFMGDADLAGIASLNVGGTFGWYTFGSVPFVGLELQDPTTVSVKNIDLNKDLVIYPNPANNVLNIANAGNNANVTIMNSLGQVVYSAVVDNNSTINTENLSEGVYFVRVNNNVSKVIIRK